jgi:uracil-DNA glycosylase
MNNFSEFIKHEFEEDYFKELALFLKEAYLKQTIYPAKEEIFNAFSYSDYQDLKVIIVGQDPYHQPNQACGLAFSVKANTALPKSLINIFTELTTDMGCKFPTQGSLIPWARQGVLLLNTILTVEANKPLSHQNKGWEVFTDKVLKLCDQHPQALVFILWGKQAQMKSDLISNPKHLILKAPHPSPLSAYHGFFGSKPFSKTNTFLKEHNRSLIDWSL